MDIQLSLDNGSEKKGKYYIKIHVLATELKKILFLKKNPVLKIALNNTFALLQIRGYGI